jgi:hypothetical protein
MNARPHPIPTTRSICDLLSADRCCATLTDDISYRGDQLQKRIAAVIASALVALAVPLASTAQAAADPIQFGLAYYNSPGSDTGSNASLNAEYVTIKNTGSSRVSLTGYTVSDRAGHTYTFGATYLGAGEYVRIHTGKGTNTASHRYWGRSWYVWNNNGDSAYVRDTFGTLRDTCYWAGGGSFKHC